jgi:TPR repeat protein
MLLTVAKSSNYFMQAHRRDTDLRLAFGWLSRAAEQGLAVAQDELGSFYANGQGVARDATQAVLWYRKAAEQGADWGQYNLAVMYWNGDGTTQAQAMQWYRKSAEQGNPYAQVALAACRT